MSKGLAEELRIRATEEAGQLRAEVERLQQRHHIVVCNLRKCEHRRESAEPGPLDGPLWSKVAYVFGLGSTSAIELCRAAQCDPHEGTRTAAAAAGGEQ